MYAILSDLHGNMYALEKVIEDMKQYDIEGIILLGDLIDYGMQSNEVIDYLKVHLQNKIICNIWGNHERAILLKDYSRFSSERGVKSAQYTASKLSKESLQYLDDKLIHKGLYEFEIENKKALAVHGSLEDFYWKAIEPENVRGNYCSYDIVFSGHSHKMHIFSKFYDADDPERRNKHAVLFINPGSVGQPRNHNPAAQYMLLDIKTLAVNIRSIEYDVKAAMALYDNSVDNFYQTRLKFGV